MLRMWIQKLSTNILKSSRPKNLADWDSDSVNSYIEDWMPKLLTKSWILENVNKSWMHHSHCESRLWHFEFYLFCDMSTSRECLKMWIRAECIIHTVNPPVTLWIHMLEILSWIPEILTVFFILWYVDKPWIRQNVNKSWKCTTCTCIHTVDPALTGWIPTAFSRIWMHNKCINYQL